jgi:hypothetical protein
MGPIRLPVFVRVSDYVEKVKKKNDRYPLIDYLGHHKWDGKSLKNINS